MACGVPFMRKFAKGFFWEDKPKRKCEKPEVTWLDDLPGLEEARAFPVPMLSDDELIALPETESFTFDTEIYPNYFLAAFRSESTGKVLTIGLDEKEKLRWVLERFHIVTFNGIKFDLPIAALACAGCSEVQLKQACDMLIVTGDRAVKVLQVFQVRPLKVNHTDLIEVAPLKGGLKMYGGRMHAPKLQDLPFEPGTMLTDDQKAIVRYYCVNDLLITSMLRGWLKEQLSLRDALSKDYGMDLRSKSDAQIAEAVITSEVEALNRVRPRKPPVEIGRCHRYNIPDFIGYQTETLNRTLELVRNSGFVVSEKGGIEMPPELANHKITIGDSTYQLGIGGLHSTESCVKHFANDDFVLIDRDVASYYPAIIMNLGLYPKHMGVNFNRIYKSIVKRRLEAKKAKNKTVAESLKITINGGFGKFGSQYSMLYSPDLMIAVTITGQLSLLMLIEAIELSGISVVSGNTDGIVIRCHKDMEPHLNAIIDWWEKRTNFDTEETRYKAVYSRDVNNYIAIKEDGSTKRKGIFANVYMDSAMPYDALKHNPVSSICVEAVCAFLTKGIPVEETIFHNRDITKFVTVRNVKGGAVHNGKYLGKLIRWYYTAEDSKIVCARDGSLVPKSEYAKPLMQLGNFPDDLDFQWYIREAGQMLRDCDGIR